MREQRNLLSWCERIAGIRIGRLGRNAMLATAALGARLLIQVGYLILLSRWLGPQGYGLFAGWIALVMLVSPLAGWGIGGVLSERVARDRAEARPLWATTLEQTAVIGLILAIFVALCASWMPRDQIGVIPVLLLGGAELVLLPAAQATTGLCFALDLGLVAAAAVCLVPVGRLLACACFAMFSAGTVGIAASTHFVGSAVGLAVSIALVSRANGAPAWRGRPKMRETLFSGSAYATGGIIGQTYLEVDKALMLQLLGAAIVGPYTVAFRAASAFAMPIGALFSAAMPRLFAAHGKPDAPPTLKLVTLTAIACGVVASVAAACAAPLMPYVFGSGFAVTAKYLFLFSPWPILMALHLAAASGLTASGRQRQRVMIEGAALVCVIGMNLLLLRPLGAVASVLALLVGEALMALGCWWVLRRR